MWPNIIVSAVVFQGRSQVCGLVVSHRLETALPPHRRPCRLVASDVVGAIALITPDSLGLDRFQLLAQETQNYRRIS